MDLLDSERFCVGLLVHLLVAICRLVAIDRAVMRLIAGDGAQLTAFALVVRRVLDEVVGRDNVQCFQKRASVLNLLFRAVRTVFAIRGRLFAL